MVESFLLRKVYHSDSLTMCRGTKLSREEIENVPKNFNSTKVISNFFLFWALKELRATFFNYQTPKKVGPHIKHSENTCHEYHFCQRDHESISHLFSSKLISKIYS